MEGHRTHSLTAPPAPRSAGDIARWTEGRLRRRLLSGQWKSDLELRLRAHFGVTRRTVMGPKSLAKNTFRKLCHELAVNYDRVPAVHHVSGELAEVCGRDGLLAKVGIWPMMRRVQTQLIGLREMLLRPDWSYETSRPLVRMVTPDVVVASAHASDPSVPVDVRELRWRVVNGEGMWTWDHLSVADPSAPLYRVLEARLDGSDGADLTQAVLGGRFDGPAYPYRWTNGDRAGEPFLPYVLYHAMRSGDLWDAYEGQEIVEGSLDVACAYSFLQHCIFRASWPQRWAVGAYVAGAVPRDTSTGPRTEIPSDPSSLLHLEAAPGVQNPQVGQWGAGIEAESLARTVSMLERAVADFDGLDFSHIVHDASANPWSAEALSITRAGKREAQERYRVELLPADQQVVAQLCCIANIQTDSAYPEDGYLIDYQTLPLSADETAARREENADLIAAGRRSVIEAYQVEHPGTTRDEAIQALNRIAADNQKYGGAAAPSVGA